MIDYLNLLPRLLTFGDEITVEEKDSAYYIINICTK